MINSKNLKLYYFLRIEIKSFRKFSILRTQIIKKLLSYSINDLYIFDNSLLYNASYNCPLIELTKTWKKCLHAYCPSRNPISQLFTKINRFSCFFLYQTKIQLIPTVLALIYEHSEGFWTDDI